MKILHILTLEKVAIVNGIIVPAVMQQGWRARIINKMRFLAFLDSNLYHSRLHIVRYTSLHLRKTYTKIY
jgi:hypothetical protein